MKRTIVVAVRLGMLLCMVVVGVYGGTWRMAVVGETDYNQLPYIDQVQFTVFESADEVAINLNQMHADPTLRAIFQNKDFRIGLSYAIDRQVTAGCTAHLAKPVQTKELFQVLDRYLGKGEES